MSDGLDHVWDDLARPREKIGEYEVVEEIARGGMGTVYRAFDRRLDREVAIKVLHGRDARALENFRREAKLAAALAHPNVVPVHDVGPDHIVMEYIEGETLAEAMPRMDRDERLEVLETVARAVAHAHAGGIVHRDLKPHNVLIEGKSGRVLLTDFGLARDERSREMAGGPGGGTPAYMAPEQVSQSHATIGPRADVWALGVMLYEMLAGRRPFEASPDGTVRDDPPPLSGVPRDLASICRKALEKDPARRYADAGGFAGDLRRHLDGEPVEARRGWPGERALRRLWSGPWGRALVIALLMFAISALGTCLQIARSRTGK